MYLTTSSSLSYSAAILAKVISRDMNPQQQQSDKTKFNLHMQTIFKKNKSLNGPLSNNQLRRSTIVSLFVSNRDLECKCPKLKLNKWVEECAKWNEWELEQAYTVILEWNLFPFRLIVFPRTYLILGKDADGPQGALGISSRSLIVEWREDWTRRLRRYDQECD